MVSGIEGRAWILAWGDLEGRRGLHTWRWVSHSGTSHLVLSLGRCPKPLKNRDVVTLRSWLPMGSDYIIMNYSVKHPVSLARHQGSCGAGLRLTQSLGGWVGELRGYSGGS